MTQRPVAKILMVDDRPENLLALEAVLQGLGHELIKAASGEETLKCLLTTEIAVILLDVQMPGMDGFETAAHVKSREKTRDIPILFLTAINGEAHQAFRGYAAGAVDYLAKPFDPWVLKAKVCVFVELSQRRSELTAQAEGLRRQLAQYHSPGLEGLSRQACEAVQQAQALHQAYEAVQQAQPVQQPPSLQQNRDPAPDPDLIQGLAIALEHAATATQALREALNAPTTRGITR